MQEGPGGSCPGPVVEGQSLSFTHRKDRVTAAKKKLGNGEEFGEI